MSKHAIPICLAAFDFIEAAVCLVARDYARGETKRLVPVDVSGIRIKYTDTTAGQAAAPADPTAGTDAEILPI